MENANTIPVHVAIIPDGNRRWATARGQEAQSGHLAGAKRIEEISNRAWQRGITHLSLWGSSLENLTKRPIAEKKALLRIYEEYFTKMIASDVVKKERVQIKVIGRWREQFPASLVTILEQGIDATKDNDGPIISFFLAYSGDDEMLGAVRRIVGSGAAPEDITPDTIKENLLTHDLPPVDYLIRTGGEPHLSVGFMMWDTANAQLYFTDALFPDFDVVAFDIALEEYATRARRHGA